MAAMSSLPSDILFEVFVLFGNLQDLRSTILSCRALFEAFQHRRFLILERVFSRQITQTCVHTSSYTGAPRIYQSGVRLEVDAAKNVIAKCKTMPQDALHLHLAGWETMLSLHDPGWLDCCWGLQLVDRHFKLLDSLSTLKFMESFWARVTGQTDPKQPSGAHPINRCRHESCHTSLAQKLAIMYIQADRLDACIDVIRQYHDSAPNLRSYGLLATLMSYCRRTSTANEQMLILFFQEQVEKERSALRTKGYQVPGRTTAAQHHWTICLSSIFAETGREDEAMQVMEDALEFAIDNSVNKTPAVGLSRRLIKMYQQQQDYEKLLRVRRRICDLLSPMTTTTASQYVAWAKGYTHDLRLASRHDEAKAVDKEVWDNIRNRLSITHDNSLIYHARNAAWALSKSYEIAGQRDEANEVQKIYEHMASASSVPSKFMWPANSAWREDYAVERDLEIPIMVPRYS